MPIQALPSEYKFTQPVRYYKANDPYYFEVDNLPIRQLEENVLWMKDQLFLDSEGTQGPIRHGDDIDIEYLKPLRAKSQGARTISVNPGKFTARINSSMYTRDDYLSYLTAHEDDHENVAYPKISEIFNEAFSTTQYEDLFKKFIESSNGNGAPTRMVGLETLFTHHIGGAIVNPPGTFGAATAITTGTTHGVPDQVTPTFGTIHRWPLVNHANIEELDLVTAFTRTFENLTYLHTEFVQFWRSVVRTSVVDFRGGEIEIPPFDPYDFYYEDAGGNDVSLSSIATQRIDLLVVYSMPIDDTSAALAKYETAGVAGNATPKVITEPTLGIVKGAGVGIKLTGGVLQGPVHTKINTKEFGDNTPDPEMPKILANINDANSDANYGLRDRDGTVIHGSFPSPDDLINLAPNFLLAEDGSGDSGNTNLQQIGQTAMPVAYVVVKDCANVTTTDIIDIRPFLRTTEFTYNERAGIAAAFPPLSFANPAIGAMQLQDALDRTAPAQPGGESYGVNLYSDVIQGGLSYGPEGCLLMMYENYTQTTGSPWEILTTHASYIDSGGTSHDFTGLTDPWQFTQADTNTRRAAIEFLYVNHQADLKKWLCGAEYGSYTKYGSNNTVGQYLNLPEDRKISLWPEWDMMYTPGEEADLTAWQAGDTGGSWRTLLCNSWTFFDYYGRQTRGEQGGNDYAERIPKYFSPGIDNEGGQLANEFGGETVDSFRNAVPAHITYVQFCKKTIKLKLPGWVEDFDVNIDYTNTIPAASHGHSFHGVGGLRIQKGAMVSEGQNKTAYFTILSAAGAMDGIAANIDGGRLNFDNNSNLPHYDMEIAHMNYRVIQPEWQQPYYRLYRQYSTIQTGGLPTQTTGIESNPRKMARFGLCHYPTVKFNIVGYPRRKTVFPGGIATNEVSYTGGGSFSNLVAATEPPLSHEGYLDLTDDSLFG